jgi:LPS-assembly protein
MANRKLFFPGIVLLGLTFATQATAEESINSFYSPFSQCQVDIPEAEAADETPLSQLPVVIEAGYAHAQMGVQASFRDGVELNQGDRHLKAEQAVVDQQNNTLTADGSISYSDNLISVESEQLSADLLSRRASLANAQYQLHGLQGRGEASNLQISDKQNVSLEKAVYTGCPPGDKSWSISADSIVVDQEEEWAIAHNAVVRVMDIPILYLPYFTYPISDRRRSGLLFPSYSSNDGGDISTPFYWDIAPEYDATITPREMVNRGVQLSSEFRYLVDEQQGQFNIEYMPNDLQENEDRTLAYWSHDGFYKKHWEFEVDYTRVSDDSYLSDLGSDVASSSDTELNQRGEVSYHELNWDAGIIINHFQILDDSDEAPHQLMPQLYFSGLWDSGVSPIQFGLDAEVSKFSHEDSSLYQGERFHVEPSLQIPMTLPAGFINTELSVMHTRYSQDINDYSDLSESVVRTLPKFRLHTGLNLERNIIWADRSYRQTLEPQLQYLYIPYQDQSDIGIYDSDELQQDYHALFRDVRYSGLDRIADANQITIGATTRFFDQNSKERLRLAIGQKVNISESRVTLDDDEDAVTDVLATELDASFSDEWFFHAGSQFDTSNDELSKANSALEWQPDPLRMIQLNYRYAMETESMVSDVNQLGLKTSWPINNSIHFVGSYYRDLDLGRTSDLYTGIQFNSCCWSVRLGYKKELSTSYLSDGSLSDTGTLESSFSIKFEIKGIGGIDTIADSEMLNSGSFEYGRPFYLNN